MLRYVDRVDGCASNSFARGQVPSYLALTRTGDVVEWRRFRVFVCQFNVTGMVDGANHTKHMYKCIDKFGLYDIINLISVDS